MKCRRAEIKTDSFLAVAFLLMMTSSAMAQAPGPPPIDRTANMDRIRQQDMSKREYQLRNFGKNPNSSSDNKQLKAIGAQIEQDFNRISFLHNQIARATSSEQPVDYQFVSDATAEIKKRATRLQSTLALRDPENSVRKTDEFESLEMKASLIALCKQIRSFVTNPIIDNPGTINADQLAAARRDLQSIIIMSGHIKRNADKLSSK